MTTAYFVPDSQLLERICAAAMRGVEVDLLLPGPHADKRFVQLGGEGAYEHLLECGVRVWHFQTSMLHAKVMTVDGTISNIGSANLNSRSSELDEEINLVVLDPELAATLDDQFDEDLKSSEQIEPGRWRRRPLHQRAMERVARLFRHTI